MRCKNCGLELDPGTVKCPRCFEPVVSAGPQWPNRFRARKGPDAIYSGKISRNEWRAANQETTYLQSQPVFGKSDSYSAVSYYTFSDSAVPETARTGFKMILAGAIIFLIMFAVPVEATPELGETNCISIFLHYPQARFIGLGCLLNLIAIACSVYPLRNRVGKIKKYKWLTVPAYLQFFVGYLVVNFLLRMEEHGWTGSGSQIWFLIGAMMMGIGGLVVSSTGVKNKRR